MFYTIKQKSFSSESLDRVSALPLEWNNRQREADHVPEALDDLSTRNDSSSLNRLT